MRLTALAAREAALKLEKENVQYGTIENTEFGYNVRNTGVSNVGNTSDYETSDRPASIPLIDSKTEPPLDRRESMFFGAPPKALEFSAARLPKCFTDGSNIKARYNHYGNESIEDFLRVIEIQLRPYPVYQWIPLVRKQLGKTVELAVQQYEVSLFPGRHNMQDENGLLSPCPAGFYAYAEFKDWLLIKYHRPLREIRVIQKALFEMKQGQGKVLNIILESLWPRPH